MAVQWTENILHYLSYTPNVNRWENVFELVAFDIGLVIDQSFSAKPGKACVVVVVLL